jgi:hypothetical protein
MLFKAYCSNSPFVSTLADFILLSMSKYVSTLSIITRSPFERTKTFCKSSQASLNSLVSRRYASIFSILEFTVLAYIPHFIFIKILFHEFPTAMNLPNEVCYTNLHSYS